MSETRPPHNRTIGECMTVSKQRGMDDWLSGASSDENPYVEEDYISHTFWLLGWHLADGALK
jgi:ribosome modulation factor